MRLAEEFNAADYRDHRSTYFVGQARNQTSKVSSPERFEFLDGRLIEIGEPMVVLNRGRRPRIWRCWH